jgi:hypothetical protein
MNISRSTATKYSKESQLLEPVARFAKRRGFCLQSAELPFYEYRIDLYGFSRRKNATVAIELKLKNWRRALEQTLLYQLCADLVYIAMPEGSAMRVDKSQLESTGIGLIAVRDSGTCTYVVLAKQHGEVHQPYRVSQIDYLKGLSQGDYLCLK